MAMRIYTSKQFEKELVARGLRRTEFKTSRTEAWEDSVGNQVLVPCGLLHYPDYVLDEVLRAWKEVSYNGESFDEKTFTVKKK